MAQHGTSQDQVHLVDENEIGSSGTAMGFAPAATTTQEHQHHHDEGQQQLSCSGSSSSSSSEDDGEGGRRKKKGIKETLTTDENKEIGDHQQAAQITSTAANQTEGGEKKGMIDKIKEKIPGMH